jgi:hypothetical protein
MISVDSIATAITPRTTGSHALIQNFRLRRLLDMVVGVVTNQRYQEEEGCQLENAAAHGKLT